MKRCCCTGQVEGIRGGNGGSWELLLESSGVVAMHMALTRRNTVLMFDQTGAGPSRLRPPGDPCHDHDDDDPSCWAHSVEYDIATNTIRPLVLKTDPWCSAGAFLPNGTLAQIGGYGAGARKIRYFRPCSDRRCDWIESGSLLADDRWYATSQALPEKGRVLIVGGIRVSTYEFLPKSSDENEGAFQLPFLRATDDRRRGGNNLYPFLHLSSDGNLFIFANRDSILFDYHRHRVVKRFPRIPGGGARNYPSTGSSVMLPLDHRDDFKRAEVMVCGGAASGAYGAAKGGDFWEGLRSCGRMVITDENPTWAMEEMPGPRLMNDMLILPDGSVLVINGATHGCAGWGRATNGSYSPYLYKPWEAVGRRFSVLRATKIARMYHSSALVLPDGRVLVAGSNPYKTYNFSGAYPTELRVEAFTPPYMSRAVDVSERASNVWVHHGGGRYGIRYGEEFVVRFELAGEETPARAEFYVYAPPFATHSISMGQRMVKLGCSSMGRERTGRVRAVVRAPPSPIAAPSGYYLLTVVNGGNPSSSIWVRFIQG